MVTCGEGHRELQTCAVISGEGLGQSLVGRGYADVQSLLAHILAFSEGIVASYPLRLLRFRLRWPFSALTTAGLDGVLVDS
jgi:hypothetical protein